MQHRLNNISSIDALVDCYILYTIPSHYYCNLTVYPNPRYLQLGSLQQPIIQRQSFHNLSGFLIRLHSAIAPPSVTRSRRVESCQPAWTTSKLRIRLPCRAGTEQILSGNSLRLCLDPTKYTVARGEKHCSTLQHVSFVCGRY